METAEQGLSFFWQRKTPSLILFCLCSCFISSRIKWKWTKGWLHTSTHKPQQWLSTLRLNLVELDCIRDLDLVLSAPVLQMQTVMSRSSQENQNEICTNFFKIGAEKKKSICFWTDPLWIIVTFTHPIKSSSPWISPVLCHCYRNPVIIGGKRHKREVSPCLWTFLCVVSHLTAVFRVTLFQSY